MEETILNGVNVPRTLNIMGELVNKFSNDVHLFLDNNIKTKIEGCTLESFFDLVKKLPFNYEEIKIGEILQRPGLTLLFGGDCDDKAILMAAFIREFLPDYKSYFKAVYFGDGDFSHVYNQIEKDGEIYPIDATYHWHFLGFEKPYKGAYLWSVD